MPNDDVVLGEGITGGLGLEGHHAMPRVKLASNRLETRRGERVDRDLSKELTGSGRGRDGNGEESLSVSEVDL
jgi:hypothetical protein